MYVAMTLKGKVAGDTRSIAQSPSHFSAFQWCMHAEQYMGGPGRSMLAHVVRILCMLESTWHDMGMRLHFV